MDAKRAARELEKEKLLRHLAELMVEEQRESRVFEGVPHYTVLEDAAHELGKQASKSGSPAACSGGNRGDRSRERRLPPVTLTEQMAHCPACRQDFFPSA